MTTTKTTADLLWCPTFRGFLQHWIEHKRPALEMVDYLLEMDYPNAAAAILWAATVEDKCAFLSKDGFSGPFPFRGLSNLYHWVINRTDYKSSDVLPWKVATLYGTFSPVTNITEALIWMMDSCPWTIE